MGDSNKNENKQSVIEPDNSIEMTESADSADEDKDTATEKDSDKFNDVQSTEIKMEGTEPAAVTVQERLMISKIVNHNFKSYAGTQVLGPFHKNFSCIIGPNGSGKSNVIDSMLFVFGYRSAKIRSKKLSVLIHNSEQHPNCTSCTVEVHFQMIRDINDDDYEVVSGSEFYVSRTATKSNTSTYTINGKTSTVKEVSTLLKASGIDLDHNRFLILQGEVEQISLMKPKAPNEHEDGMLEYMEDIIGTNVYKQPIEELATKVEQLNEARGEKLNRVKAAEKEKESLEGPKNEACEFIREDNELTLKKYTLSQTFIHECSKLIEKAQEKKTEQEAILAEVNKEAKDVFDKKTELENGMIAERKLLAKVERASEKAKKEFEEFEKRDLKVREDLKHNKAKIKKLTAKVGGEKKKLEELVDLPTKSTDELEQLQDRLRCLDEDKIRKEGELETLKQEIQPQIQKINEHREVISGELMDIKKVVNEWQSKVNISQSEMDLLTREKTKKEQQLEEARSNLERVAQSYKDETNKAKELMKTVPLNERRVNEQQDKLDQLIREEKTLTSRLSETKTKFSEAKSALNAASTRSRLLEGLLREKTAGRLPGLCGRLGDLGTISDRYDVAVSTACGALNNIVCDNMDTAQKALEFIKNNNLGIATFIALDKMEPYAAKARDLIDIPPNSHRLYDLVKQRDGSKYSGAFYYALRDTLVAPSTDLAKKIAYGKTKRWRVVTLDGVMIDISGTMAGGGNTVIKGLMSKVTCDIDPKEVDKMSDEINNDQRRLEEISTDKTKLEQEVRGLLKTLSADKFTKQKSEQAIKSYMKQQSSLQKDIPILEEQLKAIVPDENKIAEIQKKINGHQSKLDEVSLKARKKDDMIKKCDKDLKDLNNKKLKPHQESVRKTEEEIDSVHDQITKIKVALKGLDRNKDKLEKSISEIERELSEAQTHMEDLKLEFQKIEEQAEVVVEKDNMCQDKMKEQTEKMEALKAELAGLEKDLEAHEQKTVDYRHAIDKHDGVIKENGSKIRHWKKEMSKHVLQNIPGEAELEPLKPIEADELEKVDAKNLEYEIAVLEEALKQKQPNMAVIKEYLLKHSAWEDKVAELNQITSERDTARDKHEELRKKRLSEFMAGFFVITNKLKEMYQMITLGGDAELELVDTLDPFSEGIVFSVRPPKKSWKNISNLSGGEKTLSSLALVFALHHYKPSPLYVMDEIDAALDFKNVSIVAHYIKERTKNAQFIIISLRNNMFELGDHLIGIYKTDNATKSVTINPNSIAAR